MSSTNPNLQAPTPSSPGQHPNESPPNALPCNNPQCQQREVLMKREIDRLLECDDERAAEIREKNAEIRGLQQRIRELDPTAAAVGKRTERTWPMELRSYLKNSHPVPSTYAGIYRKCCMEENMSTQTRIVHPDIKFVRRYGQSLRESDTETEPEGDDEDTGEEDVFVGGGSVGEAATAQGIIHEKPNDQPFPFEKLPWQTQAQILRLLLHKPGTIIHCLSRLDPYSQPDDFPSESDLGETRSGLMNRFYWGPHRELSLSQDGIPPNDILGLLTVSQRFYFLGIHIFYSLNTFAFSSLGELGRFCQGSGLHRVARIQHIELLLTGSQYLTAPVLENTRLARLSRAAIVGGRTPKAQPALPPLSRRTYPLTWLAHTSRLKTLVVHLNETVRFHIRRGYEHDKVKAFLQQHSAGQPNQRMTRSLRCLQGLDYIYQLRGMEWVRFYDFNQVLRSARSVRQMVRDWSFVEDVMRVATMEKTPLRAEQAELENLPPLLPVDFGEKVGNQEDEVARRESAEEEGEKWQRETWMPGPDDWALVKSVFAYKPGQSSSDDMRMAKRKRRDTAAARQAASHRGSSSVRAPSLATIFEDPSDVTDGFTSDTNDDTISSATLIKTDSDDDETSDSEDASLSSPSSAGLFTGSDDDSGDLGSDEISSSDDSSDSDSGSDLDSSDPDSNTGSRRSFKSILNAHLASQNAAAATQTRVSPYLKKQPSTSSTPSRVIKRRESSTASPPRVIKRRSTTTSPPDNRGSNRGSRGRGRSSSTGMFVSPGPGNPFFARAASASSTPAPGLDNNRPRRESTDTSGLFMTPGPSNPNLAQSSSFAGGGGGGGGGLLLAGMGQQQLVKRERRGTTPVASLPAAHTRDEGMNKFKPLSELFNTGRGLKLSGSFLESRSSSSSGSESENGDDEDDENSDGGSDGASDSVGVKLGLSDDSDGEGADMDLGSLDGSSSALESASKNGDDDESDGDGHGEKMDLGSLIKASSFWSSSSESENGDDDDGDDDDGEDEDMDLGSLDGSSLSSGSDPESDSDSESGSSSRPGSLKRKGGWLLGGGSPQVKKARVDLPGEGGW